MAGSGRILDDLHMALSGQYDEPVIPASERQRRFAADRDDLGLAFTAGERQA
jgi:hypothetical protein